MMKLLLLLACSCVAKAEPAVLEAAEEELDLSNALGVANELETSSKAPSPESAGEQSSALRLPDLTEVYRAPSGESDDRIESLERSVLKLANEGASPGMTTFLEELSQLVEVKMMEELRQQHLTMNKSLEALYKDIPGCATADYRESLNVALKHDVPPRLTAEEFGLPKLADEHRSCRSRQRIALDEAQVLEVKLKGLEESKLELCDSYARQEVNRTLPVGDSSTCVMDIKKYPVSSHSRHIDYLKDQLAAWDAQYQAIHIAGIKCRKATQDYASLKPNVSVARAAVAESKKTCDEDQAKMDETSCNLRETIEKKCELIASCTDTKWKLYSEQATTSVKEEEFLKAQMKALLRIQCYLGAFVLKDMSIGLADCNKQDYQSRPEVSALGFLRQQKPAPAGCPLEKSSIAGFCAYEGLYYGNTSGLSVPCTATCCQASCVA